MELIREADLVMLSAIQSIHSPILDEILLYSGFRMTWLPLYLFLGFKASKSFKGQSFFIFLVITSLLVASTDQASVWMKDHFMRLRPCHDPSVSDWVRLVGNCGGLYGFVSSHAANAGGITTFLLILLHRSSPWFFKLLVPWTMLICLCRVYNGVHFPTDVMAGLFLGSMLGFLWAVIFKRAKKSLLSNHHA